MDPVLDTARARYSALECVRADPTHEQYAAAHRWLACARDAIRWSRQAPSDQEGLWLAKACDALVRADQHRGWARRWRAGAMGVGTQAPTPAVPGRAAAAHGDSVADDAESAAFEARLRERVRAKSAIHAYYAAARHSLALVRVYRAEAGTTGRREREALSQVLRYRRAIRDLREAPLLPGDVAGPGLRKTVPPKTAPSATETLPEGGRKTSTG